MFIFKNIEILGMWESNSVYVAIGDNIKKYRLERGWTQQDLANRCKSTNREKISRMENSRSDYMLSTLLDVCEALSVDLMSLIDGKGDR